MPKEPKEASFFIALGVILIAIATFLVTQEVLRKLSHDTIFAGFIGAYFFFVALTGLAIARFFKYFRGLQYNFSASMF